MEVLFGALFVGAGCAGSAGTGLAPLSLELRLHTGKAAFYDGEPVHVTFELRNAAPDTAFLPPWGLGAHWLTAQLFLADGSEVPRTRDFWVDYIFSPGYRGDPLPPGESLFETDVLQTRWGQPSTLSRSLSLYHLPPGDYELRATFRPDVNPPTGRASRSILSAPVGFTVLSRDPRQDSLYASYEQFAAPLDVTTWQAEHFSMVLNWCDARLAEDSLDATVNNLVTAAVNRAIIRGFGPDSAGFAWAQGIRTRLARAQDDRPSGAAAVDAYYALTEWLRRGDPSLTAGLGPSLAGRVAAAWDRRLAARRH